MYTDLIFICYIMAIFLSLLCLALIALVLVHKDYRGNRVFVAARNFAGTVTLTGLLYFIFYYRETVQERYELFLPFRIVDYALFCLLLLFWLFLVFRLIDKETYGKLLLFSKVFTGVRFAASLIVTTGFMGPYYNISIPLVRNMWSVLEALFTVIAIVLIALFALAGVRECVSRLRRLYILTCSLLLGIWLIIQCLVDIGLFFGTFGVSAWMEKIPDLTGTLMCLCSVATFLFVFKEDFSPLFFADNSQGQIRAECGIADGTGGDDRTDGLDGAEREKQELTERIERIAEIHKLTVREKEVLELVYDGYTNPDIAEALCISINTVKKHIRNLYEKLGVNSRMETVHLVNARNR